MTAQPAPEAVARVIEAMQGYPGEWCLCGGWGVDAWLGRQTREHMDVDIVTFERDLGALHAHFEGWHLLAHDELDPDSEQQWELRPLALPAHIHARKDGIDLDIQVTRCDGDAWLVYHAPPVVIQRRRALQTTSWCGTLAPELLLFYKTLEARPHDLADLELLLPRLEGDQTRWLEEAIASVR